MRMSLEESVFTYLVPPFSDALTGFGLSVLLEFSRTSPELPHFFLVCLGMILVAGLLAAALPPGPAWVSLCNATFSMVLTLSLALNLLAQLCPPSGKELTVIPAYVLLCIPRARPSGRALVLQYCLTVLLVCVFMLTPAESYVRPEGGVGELPSLAVSVAAGCLLQTFPRSGLHPECLLYERSRGWAAAGVAAKGAAVLAFGALRDTPVYNFMFDKPNAAPAWLFAGYGVLLLFACMQASSVWFGLLKEVLGKRVQWRLVVRIQHIIYALFVAAAWVFPLQLHGLRVLILGILVGLNCVYGFLV